MIEFQIIQHEQTPVAPKIENVPWFIENNKKSIELFKEYAISKKNAIGLAANQCSLDGERFNLRVIAVKDIKTHECTIAINPIIVKCYGIKRQRAEGCLTWGAKDRKYFCIIADRYHFIDVEFFTADGVFHKETHKGFQAQVWQHEVSHINGIEEKVVSDEIILEEPIDKNTGRNDVCPCGSGKKYKKCCIDEDI